MKGNLIAIGVGVVLGVVIITMNWFNAIEANETYMKEYGYEYINEEWTK